MITGDYKFSIRKIFIFSVDLARSSTYVEKHTKRTKSIILKLNSFFLLYTFFFINISNNKSTQQALKIFESKRKEKFSKSREKQKESKVKEKNKIKISQLVGARLPITLASLFLRSRLLISVA